MGNFAENVNFFEICTVNIIASREITYVTSRGSRREANVARSVAQTLND